MSGFVRLATFLDLIKFTHSIFALPFALFATVIGIKHIWSTAPAHQWLGRLGLIVVAMIIARTVAMTVNRLADRALDAANPRTAQRPSVTGSVSPFFMRAIIILGTLGFALVASAFWWLYANPWPTLLALPVLGWLALYSYTKRATWLCHYVLGISLALAPLAAWIALVPPYGPLWDLRVLLLAGAVVFWVAGFDILYALQDEDFDRQHHLHSIPARFGRTRALWISRLSHIVTIGFLIALGWWGGLHGIYWLGCALAVVLLGFEQSLVSPRDISKVNVAFMTVNGWLGMLYCALGILAALWA